MASILTILVKGNLPSDIKKNFVILDKYFSKINNQFIIFSKENLNPRIYYSSKSITSKDILNIIHHLKQDKDINYIIKQIAYISHLNII